MSADAEARECSSIASAETSSLSDSPKKAGISQRTPKGTSCFAMRISQRKPETSLRCGRRETTNTPRCKSGSRNLSVLLQGPADKGLQDWSALWTRHPPLLSRRAPQPSPRSVLRSTSPSPCFHLRSHLTMKQSKNACNISMTRRFSLSRAICPTTCSLKKMRPLLF